MMKKKLIVVADDFGFSEAYNYGVLKGYRDGIVTTLSLMSNMAAAPPAVALRNRECIVSGEGVPIAMELPRTVVFEIAETEPSVKGQTASSSYKPAKANNGVRIMIPPYMGVGERIVVDTSTGEYVRRAD